MTSWEATLAFMDESPFLSFFLALIIGHTLVAPFRYAFKAYNRRLRSRNIAAKGWPPAHLDADGDWKPEPEGD